MRIPKKSRLVLAAVVASGLVWFVWPRERSLMERAVRVAAAGNVAGTPLPETYFWLTGRRVAIARKDAQFGYQFVACDITRGAEVPLTDSELNELPHLASRYAQQLADRAGAISALAGPSPAPHGIGGKMPPGAYMDDAARSYRGNRLAWLLKFERPAGFPPWLLRMMPALKRPARSVLELWISDGQGRKFRRIGVLEAVMDSQYAPFSHGLQWAPDDTRVSFIHRGLLYTLPVD